MAEPTIVRLPIFVRKVLGESGETTGVVYCARSGSSRDARDCFRCERLLSRRWEPENGGDVVCTAGMAAQPPHVDRRMDFGEAAARTELHQLVRGSSFCVRPETPVKVLLQELSTLQVRVLAVVDERYRLLGTVTRLALLATRAKDARVGDVMTAATHTLTEHSPVAHAIAWMAVDDVDVVPIVAEDGAFVALLEARDLFRWTAERMGYVTTAVAGEQAKKPEPRKKAR